MLYQAGRHNKQLWKVVTELNGGDNQVPYGSCIFEAHVMTTLQENYYKWLFLLLSDIDEVKDEHFESRFKMEYECDDDEIPLELIDYQETNNRLEGNVEIIFDTNETDRRQLFKVIDRNSIGLYVFIHTSHRYVLHRYCCYEDSTK